MELQLNKPGFSSIYKPGYGTEYTDNYDWNQFHKSKELNKELFCQPLCETTEKLDDYCLTKTISNKAEQKNTVNLSIPCKGSTRNPAYFESTEHPCVYRETTVRKDEHGRYVDPFKNVITSPSGRRLMYDPTHPDMIYGSQWSSELADPHGPYSFPTTTGLDPEITWTKEMQWQVESEVGRWPTDQWKTWTKVAVAPPYDGFDDQVQYSKYKVQVPSTNP